MRKLTAALSLTIAMLIGSVGVSWSADFNKGFEAYNRGDYATALREWKPLAEQGVHWVRLAAEQPVQLNYGL